MRHIWIHSATFYRGKKYKKASISHIHGMDAVQSFLNWSFLDKVPIFSRILGEKEAE